jgi:SAM-dependent methyltransferase
MSAQDLARWQARWQERPPGEDVPEPFLSKHLADLRPGAVLDVAAGAGRNTLFLASHGFAVTALDIAPAALDRLRKTAAAAGLPIVTRCADLDDPSALESLGPFDDLIIVRYRPAPAQWPHLLARLRPGGLLLLCSFGPAEAGRKGFPRAFCLDRAEVGAEIGALAELLLWRSWEEASRALEGSLWRRLGPCGPGAPPP